MTTKTFFPLLFSSLFFSSAFLGIGCTDDGSDTETAAANQTEGRRLEPIKGREWARCSFDNAGALSCTSTARGSDPLGATVKVMAASATGTFRTLRATLDIDAGGTVILGTFARAEFPVLLQINAELTREARELVGETSGIDLNFRSMLNGPDALRAPNQAAVLKQPFDLWPVAFIDSREQNLSMSSFELITTPYTKPIAPYKAFLETMTEMKLSKQFYGRDIERKVAYLIAPPSGPIAMKLRRGQNETNVSLTGPGYWAIKDDGSIATAPPDLITRDFPTPATPPP